MIGILQKLLLLTLVACGIASAQESRVTSSVRSSDLSVVLGNLSSLSGSKRSEALEDIRSHPADLKKANVRRALLELLDRENHELDSQLAEAQRKGYPDQESSDEEEFAIYYSELVDTVDSFANWSDPLAACILVEAASSDDSQFAAEIASHAAVTIPCLLKRANSPISMNRAVAVPVLIQALANAKATVDAATLQQSTQAILAALDDTDEAVKIFTVHALGNFGGADMLHALKIVAESDPSPEVEGRSVRKEAAQAIAAIEKRGGLRRQ